VRPVLTHQRSHQHHPRELPNRCRRCCFDLLLALFSHYTHPENISAGIRVWVGSHAVLGSCGGFDDGRAFVVWANFGKVAQRGTISARPPRPNNKCRRLNSKTRVRATRTSTPHCGIPLAVHHRMAYGMESLYRPTHRRTMMKPLSPIMLILITAGSLNAQKYTVRLSPPFHSGQRLSVSASVLKGR
jgi:hypothetical protein